MLTSSKEWGQLLLYWNRREEQFVKYYIEEYKDRAGIYVQNHAKLVICMVVEKWALCYQQFDHQDIDTNKASVQFMLQLDTILFCVNIASITNSKLVLNIY